MTLKQRYQGVINYFKTHVPVAETELHYTNPYELIVAVILSAQCTDKRINLVTPKLFNDYPNAEALALASSDTIFNYIRSVSYPNNKAKHLVNMANMLLTDFNGVIPSDINELVKLPGVGRKTANVVASVIYDKPAMAVDTHVFRVSNRLGLTKAKTPLQSEQQLIKHIPEQYISTAHHWLILHGRYICLARTPKCEICQLTEWCLYFKTQVIHKNAPHSLSKKTNMVNAQKTIEKNIKMKVPVKKVLTKKEVVNTIEKINVAMPRKEFAKKTVNKVNSADLNDKFIPHSTSLQVGDKAPDFKAKDQDGKTISITDFKDKNIILYFYPKDSTPGCTMEACSLKDEHAYLTKKDFVVIGVSADDEKKHKKFATKYDLPFSLLADTDTKIVKAYDVWGTKKFQGKTYGGIIRTTFIINDKGIISHVIKKIKTKDHGKQIISLF